MHKNLRVKGILKADQGIPGHSKEQRTFLILNWAPRLHIPGFTAAFQLTSFLNTLLVLATIFSLITANHIEVIVKWRIFSFKNPWFKSYHGAVQGAVKAPQATASPGEMPRSCPQMSSEGRLSWAARAGRAAAPGMAGELERTQLWIHRNSMSSSLRVIARYRWVNKLSFLFPLAL